MPSLNYAELEKKLEKAEKLPAELNVVILDTERFRALMDMLVDAEKRAMKAEFEKFHTFVNCWGIPSITKQAQALICKDERHFPDYDWHQVALEKCRKGE